jgi:GAF domain-containing protein
MNGEDIDHVTGSFVAAHSKGGTFFKITKFISNLNAWSKHIGVLAAFASTVAAALAQAKPEYAVFALWFIIGTSGLAVATLLIQAHLEQPFEKLHQQWLSTNENLQKAIRARVVNALATKIRFDEQEAAHAAAMAEIQAPLSRDVLNLRERCGVLQKAADRTSDLYAASRLVWTPVDTLTDGKVIPGVEITETYLRDLLYQMLATVVEGEHLYDFEPSERWNFAVYMYFSRSNRLECLACRRQGLHDRRLDHRSWEVGEGYVGATYQQFTLDAKGPTQVRRSLVLADAEVGNRYADYQGRNSNFKEEDRLKYRNVVTIPIVSPHDKLPAGIVFASSNSAERFTEENIEILKDMCDAITALMTHANLFEPITGRSNGEPHAD